MKTVTVKIPVGERQFWVAFLSILLSVFFVAALTYGATTIDTNSVGVGTSTPGAAVGVKGAGIFEGFVHADYFFSTSTNNSTFGGALTVTEAATSTFTGGITAGTGGLTSTGGFRVDTGEAYFDEFVGIGTTSPSSFLDVGAGSATSTVVVRGGGSVGGEIILKDSSGNGCTVINAEDGVLNATAITCPTP